MRELESDNTLVIDIGNSNISTALYCGGKMHSHKRLDTHPHPGEEDLRVLLNYPQMRISRIGIASVVPVLDDVFASYCFHILGIKPVFIDAIHPVGLRYLVSDPSFIGADLIVNLHAALKLYPGSCIILDLGTATKIQLLSSDSLYAGVAFLPGLQVSAKALTDKAAKLKDFMPATPEKLLGNTTDDALNCGIVGGHAFVLEAFVEKIKAEYPQFAPFNVILTGGLANLVAPLLSCVDIYNPYLTLDGIYYATLALDGS